MKQNNQYETIGYVGDIRLLEERGYAEINKESLHQWADASNDAGYATLFYSHHNSWTVEKEKETLLKINQDIQFKQIDNIETFKEYLDNGMDREVHPIRHIEMINSASSWKEDIESYLSDTVPSYEIQEETKSVIEKLQETINASTQIDATPENNMTLSRAYEQVKNQTHYNEATVLGNEAINASKKFKEVVTDSKDAYTHGIKNFKEHESLKIDTSKQEYKGYGIYESKGKIDGNLNVRNIKSSISAIGKVLGIVGDIDKAKTVAEATDKLARYDKKINHDFEKCMDKEELSLIEDIECHKEQIKSKINNVEDFIKESTGYKIMESEKEEELTQESFLELHGMDTEEVKQLAKENEHPSTRYIDEMREQITSTEDSYSGRTLNDDYIDMD